MKKVNVMVVDGSLLFREMLQQEMERDVNIRVVAKAADAYEASRQIIDAAPDALIVGAELTPIDGLEFLRQLLPQYSVPVIVLSADPSRRKAAEAIRGATFIEKPRESDQRHEDAFFGALLGRIHTLVNGEAFDPRVAAQRGRCVIAIGASTGGAEAIESVVTNLPSLMPPIVVSQHMPPRFTRSFADRLNAMCSLSVCEAQNGDVLIPGQVYIAPGGYHMSISRRGGKLIVTCEEHVGQLTICPSVDVMFDSVAIAVKEAAIGVLLTGMGKDGARGLKRMREAGATTIGQDEQTSVIYGMPKAAFEMGAVEMQLPLGRIAKRITELVWR